MPYADPERRRACSRAANARWYAKNPEARRFKARAKLDKKLYGLPAEARKKMEAEQGGACAICDSTTRPLCVDHSHETGKVRGLLCRRCNAALASFGDEPEMARVLFERALDYLLQ